MPIEFELEMYPEKEIVLPFFSGHISRGILLHMLQQVNPAISEQLHEPNVMKAYSVTPIYFRSKGKTEEGYSIDLTSPCRVKIRFLTEKYAQEIIEYFKEKVSLQIYNSTFQISRIGVKSKDYSELINEAEAVEAFKLYFKTPTYLATMGSEFNCLFPEQTKIFPNLMRLWNEYTTAIKFSKEELMEYKTWLTKNTGVTGYELKTKPPIIMGKKKVNGFIGWAIYKMEENEKWNKVTDMLAKFAEFSNIGGNRTGGFGVVKYTPKEIISSHV